MDVNRLSRGLISQNQVPRVENPVIFSDDSQLWFVITGFNRLRSNDRDVWGMSGIRLRRPDEVFSKYWL